MRATQLLADPENSAGDHDVARRSRSVDGRLNRRRAVRHPVRNAAELLWRAINHT